MKKKQNNPVCDWKKRKNTSEKPITKMAIEKHLLGPEKPEFLRKHK